MDNDQILSGRVAIVTGAARGIGYEISATLAATGAQVALVDLRKGLLDEASHCLEAAGHSVLAVTCDVSAQEPVRAMVKTVVERWGRVDILVNNAGICPMTPFDEITVAEWDRVQAVNLRGPFLCSQAVTPIMRQQGRGKIINIASVAGQMGAMAAGAHYSASKGGVLGLTRSLARILAPNIQVNAVAPGTTETEMLNDFTPASVAKILNQIPLGRLGKPSDIAAAVLFLASDGANYITGHTLSVNGGLYIA